MGRSNRPDGVATRRWYVMCQRCQAKGHIEIGDPPGTRVPGCSCPRGKEGPQIAPPGHHVLLRYESAAAAAFRERCRLLSNAERVARDNLALRWVRNGRGFRELPRGSRKRDELERAYARAVRQLRAVQRACAHDPFDRCIFGREFCGVCKARVESDVEKHRRHAVLRRVA